MDRKERQTWPFPNTVSKSDMESHRRQLWVHGKWKPWGHVEDSGQHLCIPCRFWKSQWFGMLLPTQVISVCLCATHKPLEDIDDGRQRTAAAAAEIPALGPAKLVYQWRQGALRGFCSSPVVCGAAEPTHSLLGASWDSVAALVQHGLADAAARVMCGWGRGGCTARCQLCIHTQSQPFACSPVSHFHEWLVLLCKWAPNQTQKQALQKVLYVAGKQPDKINSCCNKK